MDIRNGWGERRMDKKIGIPKRELSLAVVACATITAMSLWAISRATAQEVAVSPAASDQSGLVEIVVTATRRSESLQKVPISIDVVSGEALQAQGISSLGDMSVNIPDLRIVSGGPSDNLFIRGIGSGNNSGFEQSVGIFVDDIYHGRSRLSEAGFLDTARVEVLKGPQTTYFGNNAIAGAISITTVKPGRTEEGFARALWNPSFHGYEFEAAETVPLSDTFSVRGAVGISGQEGWLPDPNANRDVPGYSRKIGRLSARWEPVQELTIDLKAQYGNESEVGAIPQYVSECPPAPAFKAGPAGFCKVLLAADGGHVPTNEASGGPGQGTRLQTQEYVSTVAWELNSSMLASVTGYSLYNFEDRLELSQTLPPLFTITAPERYHQFSEEVRLASSGDHRLDYLAGAYFQADGINGSTNFNYAFLTPVIARVPPLSALAAYSPLGQADQYNQDDKTYSAFAALTWHVAPNLRLKAAARGTDVHKDFTRDVYFGTAQAPYGGIIPYPSPALAGMAQAFAAGAKLGNAGIIPYRLTNRHLSPSAGIEYDIAPTVMAYFTFTNGFKAGGFNTVEQTGVPGAAAFGPETVNSYEAGIKSEWLNKSLVVNVDLFHNEYSGLQEDVPILSGSGIINEVRNVASALSQGIEAQMTYLLTSHFTLDLSTTFLDTHYQSYANGTPTSLQSAEGQTSQNLSGQTTKYAPKIAGAFGVQYSQRLSQRFEFVAHSQVFFSGRYSVSPSLDPYLEQGSYAKVDALIALRDDSHHMEYTVIVKKINSANIRVFGTALPASPGSFTIAQEPPRSISIQAKVSF